MLVTEEPSRSLQLLQASELRYRRLFETAKDGILILDEKTGAITDVNPFLISLLGYSHDELIGVPLWEIGPFKDTKECKHLFLELQHKEYIRYDFLPLETKSGHLVAVEFVSNVYDLNDEMKVIQCNIRDITTRKDAEDALHRSEEKYRFFFQSNLAGNYVSTPDGRLLVCNSVFAAMFGFDSTEEALKQNLASFSTDPKDRQTFVDAVRSCGHVESMTRELRRPDRTPVHVIESAIGRFNEQGELTEILGYLIDETERRKADHQLRQVHKMEAVGRLAGGISHDFNNLLGIINGNSEMLLGNAEMEATTRCRVEEILKAGQSGASLTRQLLAFGRKQVLQPRVLSLNLILEDTQKMFRRLISENIEIRAVLDPNLHAVKVDPTQMEQVILNFCLNARDAMPEGGTITIETANVEVDDVLAAQHFPMKPGRYVRLAVSDTGTGMDAATLARVFEPFFTSKEPDKGTGLGLATVYGIVKQSGGHVWAYSEPGQGSTFSVYLPSATEELAPSKLEAKRIEPVRGSETILLVEDAAPLRALTRQLLERNGYTILEAEDGERATEIAEHYEGSIALLLTDVVLPKITGPALAKNLLQQRTNMKVLYMSGYTNGVIVDSGALKVGAAFLQKPFAAAELATRVRDLLGAP